MLRRLANRYKLYCSKKKENNNEFVETEYLKKLKEPTVYLNELEVSLPIGH